MPDFIEERPEASIGETFARLKESGSEYARAEWTKQSLRAKLVAAAGRDAAILLCVALILLFAALVALMVGLVIALSPMLTPIGAAVAVPAGAIILAILIALAAKARIGRAKTELSE